MIDPLDVGLFMILTAIAMTVMVVLRARRKPESKPKLLRRRPEFTASSEGTPITPSQRFDRWMMMVLARGGVRIDRMALILLVGAGSTLAVATAMVFEIDVQWQIMIGLTTFALGVAAIYGVMLRRMRLFTAQFPTSLELLARAIRAGENLESALVVAIQSREEPVRGEFRQCIRQLQLGLSPAQVFEQLAGRIGTTDVRLLAHTISVHSHLGGRLADSLERLSSVIRDRRDYLEQLKSVTGIGRFAVLAIILMTFFAFLYLSFAHPEYLDKLWSTTLGQKLMLYAAISELVGIAWVGWTLKSEF